MRALAAPEIVAEYLRRCAFCLRDTHTAERAACALNAYMVAIFTPRST